MHAKTQEILQVFKDLNKIPRCSKHEEKISLWLQEWGRSRDFEVKSDALNNVLIKASATPGYENSPILILQGHMDMVCEKCKLSKHDFSRDNIKCIHDGDWLHADGTTLGADNGIALAIGLALAEAGKRGEIRHPPLELLFTVDEETGLTGARGIESGFFEGKLLLNLDSEEEGIFIAGCAGGQNSSILLDLEWEQLNYIDEAEFGYFRFLIEGLEGGHSGVQIHRQRANGIQLLARTLYELRKKIGKENLRLTRISGGSVHNAIPNSAEASIVVRKEMEDRVRKVASEILASFKEEYEDTDPELVLTLVNVDKRISFPSSSFNYSGKEASYIKVFSTETEERFISLILGLPHGVYRMSGIIPGLVETSNNLATLRTAENEIRIVSSQRSSNMSGLSEITSKIDAVAKLAGANIKHDPGYPAWEPDLNSELLLRCKNVYKKSFGSDPKVEVIHAGLECGIIGSKAAGMQMVSLGPTIKDPHCPSERIFIPSIEKVWIFLENLLKSYC
ncbi:MAG: aminoacyl-histidine dipeptidase [Methanosarcina sp.]